MPTEMLVAGMFLIPGLADDAVDRLEHPLHSIEVEAGPLRRSRRTAAGAENCPVAASPPLTGDSLAPGSSGRPNPDRDDHLTGP